MIYETTLTKKAKKFGGMKDKLYCGKVKATTNYAIFHLLLQIFRSKWLLTLC